MKKILLVLILLASYLVYDISQQEKNTIIIYSSMEQYRGEELQRQLTKEFPDLNVRVIYVSTAKAATKISVEKENTDADIVVGLDASYMEKIKDSLADLEGIDSYEYLDGLTLQDNDNKFVTWEKQAGSFVVNKDVLNKHGLEVPLTYEDLLKPEYKNLIAMPDPKSSGTGYFFYKSIVNSRGDADALAYFDALQKNVKQFTESGSGPIKLLIQGEVAVGLGLTFQAVEEIAKGSPFEIVYPPEGSPFSLTGTGYIKGNEDDEHVREVFDFIIHDFFIYDKENFSPEQVMKKQNNTIENYPQNIHYANMDGISSIEEKERLLGLWKY